MTLQNYTIVPLDTEHMDAVCADVRAQIDAGVATCALFKMTLTPEGTPPVNKAKLLCAKYRAFRERLPGVPNGVLVQASIGHGWKLSAPSPFQKFVGLRDGQEYEVVCPYDTGFRAYIADALREIAACSPDHIMIDDDFRLLGRTGRGCACPLHLSRMNALAGTSFDRASLLAALTDETSDRREKLTELYLTTQRESLTDTARIMRRAIDEIAPAIPGSYCCVGNNAEFAAELAEIFAGAGNPRVVRVNNGNYTAAGARNLSGAFQRAAAQIAKLRGHVDVLLAETDTCPQNRYSTGAMQLHSHFCGSILEGAAGAKHWITRLSAHEPESGVAYRKILSRYRGFYETLAETVPSLTWIGCRIPVLREPRFDLIYGDWAGAMDGQSAWSACVLERLGLPLYFSGEAGGALCLEGAVTISNEEICAALSGTVLLSSDAAEELIARGFGAEIGVDVRPWTGKIPSAELYQGTVMDLPVGVKELVPHSPEVRVLSTICHSVDKAHYEPLFPGVTAFTNAQGGTVYVFAGTPRARYNLTEAFSFLCSTRKRQLTDMLTAAGELPLWYPGDEEMYFRAARVAGGGLFCALFNIGLDPIEETVLSCREPITRVRILQPSGEWGTIPFTQMGERISLSVPCLTLTPVVLLLE